LRSRKLRDALRWSFHGPRVLFNGARELFSLFRGGGLAEAMEPWISCDAIDDVPFERIAAEGMKAVLFDLENTLVPPGGPFTDDGRVIIGKARAAGLAVAVVSNASAAWVGSALAAEGIVCIAPAGKPARSGFEEACALLGVPVGEAAYVGDQVITDVLGSQRAGLRAVLVHPKYTKEFMSSTFQRLVARIVLRLAATPKRRGGAMGKAQR
jgi:HAD superfamily phosphatase (TIGR01668 family)